MNTLAAVGYFWVAYCLIIALVFLIGGIRNWFWKRGEKRDSN